jgi:SAM-dependent methyltransferase
MTPPMTVADFEARYARDPDPWDYRTSAYERDKYAATLIACGAGRRRRALELGGSIGVFSLVLAPRCDELVTIDAAPTAVATARRHLAGLPHVDARVGVLPHDLPAGPFDLVVASEILYYLGAGDLDRTLDGLRGVLAPGGRLVAVHWRPRTEERPLDAAQVHAALAAQPWLAHDARDEHPAYLLDRYTAR